MSGLGDDGHGRADGCGDVGHCANDLAPVVFIRASRSSVGGDLFRSYSVAIVVVVIAAPP